MAFSIYNMMAYGLDSREMFLKCDLYDDQYYP